MKFDWILTDLFHGKESSILMKTKNFYEQLFELINPNGWLIINCLTNDEKEIEQLTEYLKCIFNNKSYVFPIPEMMNKVLMVNKINDFNFPPEIEIYNTVE
jgi:spermidine synthase